MEQYANAITPGVEAFLERENVIRSGERWSLNFKVGAGFFSKTADIIWLKDSFDYPRGDMKDWNKIKGPLKREIKQLFSQQANAHGMAMAAEEDKEDMRNNAEAELEGASKKMKRRYKLMQQRM